MILSPISLSSSCILWSYNIGINTINGHVGSKSKRKFHKIITASYFRMSSSPLSSHVRRMYAICSLGLTFNTSCEVPHVRTGNFLQFYRIGKHSEKRKSKKKITTTDGVLTLSHFDLKCVLYYRYILWVEQFSVNRAQAAMSRESWLPKRHGKSAQWCITICNII